MVEKRLRLLVMGCFMVMEVVFINGALRENDKSNKFKDHPIQNGLPSHADTRAPSTIMQGPITRGMAKKLQQDLEDLHTEGKVLFTCFEWKPREQPKDPTWSKPAQGEG
ncbi:hypothetical protein LR48_Vigan11g058300 [Vigna angularis]|uniref:Uncharacterized protein n=1 Tax=Phaseolus angularis TaxID=3914 RepID=A0A0L9VR62_PHAAN|nr:hypothetical protein LR48_Vigan11g058300 [Vigna angularis]